MGKILAICTSPKRGTVKTEVPEATLTPEWGIETDAHGGNWHRQVSLLSAEKIENFRKKIWVDYGAFGENLVVEGFDFRNLPVTSRFQVGEVVLEMTQIGKECHNDCVIKQQTGECIMPHEGVFARVLHGGTLHVGDEMILLPPEEDPPLRAAVITLSDKGARGEREDKSGPLIVEMLPARHHPGGNLCCGHPQRPRHRRGHAVPQPEHHPAWDAQPRRQRPARQDTHRQSAGQPQSRAGESGVHPAQPRTRHPHRRRAGRRVCPEVMRPLQPRPAGDAVNDNSMRTT